MIIIIGTVIYNKGKTSVALTEADGPQSLPEELEKQLVLEGAAKYVEKKHLATKKEKKDSSRDSKEEKLKVPNTNVGAPGIKDIPEYNANMKVDDLREILDNCNITYRVGMSKVDIVAALDAYFADESNEGDKPPTPDAEEPIV